MEPAELEEALEDLEIRLERLRALYEQYFLGIEKVPPAVARTDVDRRIWALRKVQIRNTAKRYKLQTIVQRYNTFQQYWARICREIEDGTYSPHVARARKQLDPDKALTIATRRRLGMYRHSSTPPTESAREQAQHEAEPERATASTQSEHTRAPSTDAWPDPRERLSARAAAPSLAARGNAPAPVATSYGVDAWRDPREKPSASATTSSQPHGPAASVPALSRKPQGPSATSDRTAGPPQAPPRPQSLPGPPSLGPAVKRTAALEPVVLQFAPQPPARGAAGGPAPGHSTPERAPAGRSTGLTAARVEQLHRQLVEAKRCNNDPGDVDLDDLRSRLERTARQLRTQHGDRPIEFSVIVKNGRAMIKPTVR